MKEIQLDMTLGEKQVQVDIVRQGHGRAGSEIGDMHCHMHGTCSSAGKKDLGNQGKEELHL